MDKSEIQGGHPEDGDIFGDHVKDIGYEKVLGVVFKESMLDEFL